MIIKDRYNMTQEENIFSAKRILVDSVYKQANLEGIAVTYAQTNSILNNVNVSELSPKDINKICCLRDCWKYVLENLDAPIDLGYIEKIHEIVARFDVDFRYLGVPRTSEVLISGTKWRPEIPNFENVHNGLMEHLKNPNITDRALRTGLWLMRVQPFQDGNKRVGSFIINRILIENGKGLFNVPVERDGEFKEKLVEYYETDDPFGIIEYCSLECIEGVNEIPNYIEDHFVDESSDVNQNVKIVNKETKGKCI